ncbi:MAG: FAD-dependent oxidoreductase [archaeon]
MKNKNYDFAVIGAGGVGLAGAMYGARLGLKTIVFGSSNGGELSVGGLITTAHTVDNYPGIHKTTGVEIAKKIEDHARSYDLVTIKQEKVLEVKKAKDIFNIKTSKQEYKVETVLFASGRRLKRLDVPGSKEFEMKGVSYCALCDAPLYKGKTVAVIGGSDSAAVEALILAEHVKKVYIIYRGSKMRAEKTNVEKVEENKKIEIILNTNVTEIKGDQGVESVMLDKEYKGKKELKLDGVYVAIGNIPVSELAKHLGVKINKKEEIIIDHKTSETNIKGVYAAGDVADKPFKQLITGVSEGVTAAHSAYEYLSNKKIKH